MLYIPTSILCYILLPVRVTSMYVCICMLNPSNTYNDHTQDVSDHVVHSDSNEPHWDVVLKNYVYIVL